MKDSNNIHKMSDIAIDKVEIQKIRKYHELYVNNFVNLDKMSKSLEAETWPELTQEEMKSSNSFYSINWNNG